MDEAQTFAPSGAMTACTRARWRWRRRPASTASAWSSPPRPPEGLHNHIPGNAATQFFGLLNVRSQIEAAREMAEAKGGDVPDIGLLRAGQFYAAREGHPFERIDAPMCLSYHPRSPLTPDEVIRRAHGDPDPDQ